ncbi:MAG: PorT family protein [Rudanella sp.]|nr:PorT family protein [Rudanella sp.]
MQYDSKLRIGVRAGGNSVLPLEAVDNATYYPTVSFHGGLVANVGRGCLTFQPEVNYSQRHIRADFNQQGISLSAKVMTNRIEVPLLAKATFGHSSNARFFINAGPYGAYVLSERYKANLISFGNTNPALRPIIESVIAGLNNKKATFSGNDGRISYGLAGGLGVVIKAGPGQVTLEGRALYQLGDNTSTSAPDPSGISLTATIRDTKYALLQASIGYLIPIGGH